MKKIIAIIFIGALGSGLWDLFLKDSLFYLGGVFVNLISTIYDGYFDYLYSGVGKQTNFLTMIPGILIFLIIIFIPWIVNVKFIGLFRVLNSDLDENKKELLQSKDLFYNFIVYNHKKFRIVIVSIFSLISILYISILIAAISTNKAVRVVKQNLEITRPYISENEYFHLVSKFRLVDNQAKLQNLLNEIEESTSKLEVELPEYSLYGINIPAQKR